MNTSNKQIVVIYHRADFDGIFCREIARKFLGETAEYIGWHYGDATPEVSPHVTLYMLDISVPALMDHPGLIWIDHHKSAIETYKAHIPGYRIDGVAACRLAWQWFDTLTRNTGSPLGGAEMSVFASKADFVERQVSEPRAVRLAGEYDIWDKRDPNAELFQHGLRSQELTQETWDWLLLATPSGEYENNKVFSVIQTLLNGGKVLHYAQARQNESIIKELGFIFAFEGLTFLACNHARYNSHLFTAGYLPEHHDAFFGFKYHPRGDWEISLYHAPGKEHHDLSVIAKKHGGGGHRGACGFRLKTLPFSNEAILRPALEQLVGASTREDLEGMAKMMDLLPVAAENKQAAHAGIRALLETL
jgi:uncharacterized protein